MSSLLAGCAPDWAEGETLWLVNEGARMPIIVRGNSDASVTLLTVHGGIGGDSTVFIEDFYWFVEPGYRVAYWDQRHAGGASGSFRRDDWTIDLMAEDLDLAVRLLQDRYGGDVFVFGHSWGVPLTTRYLLNYEETASGVLLSNGSHSTVPEYRARLDYILTHAREMQDQGVSMPEPLTAEGETYSTLSEVIEWVEDNDPVTSWAQLETMNTLVDAVYDYVIETYYQPIDHPGPIPTWELIRGSHHHPFTFRQQGLWSAQRMNNYNQQRSVQEFYDWTNEMDGIDLPVSLLFGRYDHIIGPEVAESYYASISTPEEDKELIFFDASGHSPQFRDNERFMEHVLNFIATHE
ncbi:MAG: alpha/beta fold hydrolase [Myxococcota bacterium]